MLLALTNFVAKNTFKSQPVPKKEDPNDETGLIDINTSGRFTYADIPQQQSKDLIILKDE